MSGAGGGCLAGLRNSFVVLTRCHTRNISQMQRQSLSGIFGRKLQDPLDFSTELDMAPYLAGGSSGDASAVYDLFAVTVRLLRLRFVREFVYLFF